MMLVLTVTYHQRTTDGVDSYVGVRITKLLMLLVLSVMYHQCITDGVGSYIEG